MWYDQRLVPRSGKQLIQYVRSRSHMGRLAEKRFDGILGIQTVQLLTGVTMAVFRIQRLLPAQLILDPAAMAAGLIAHMKVRVIVVDLVGRSMLPCIDLSFRAAVVAVVSIRPVCRGMLSHDSRLGMELDLIESGQGS